MPLRQNLEQTYAAYFTAKPQLQDVRHQGRHVVEVPNVPNSVEVWQTFRDAWSKSVIFGEEDPNAGAERGRHEDQRSRQVT